MKNQQSNQSTIASIAKKTAFVYIASIVAVLCIAFVALGVGRFYIGLDEILAMALRWASACIGNGVQNLATQAQNAQYYDTQFYIKEFVLLDFRAPRVLLAIVMGAGLSMAGCAFQSLFSNPLATPDILGVTSASSFGAVLGLMFGLSMLGVFAFGFAFGIASLMLVVAVSYSRFVPLSTISMILSGIIISALFSSLVSLVKYLADPQDTLPSITYWLLGSLSRVWSGELALGVVAVCLGCAVLFLARWKLNILSLSEEEAKSLGVNLNALRAVVILSCTLIVSVSVSLCGIIGWVGLLVPHIARLLVGSESSRLLPLNGILGAGFVIIIDTISRSLSSSEIPISILTALIGAPFFIYILHKNKGGIKL